MNILGLATLLERVGCFFFKVNFKNLFLIYLWVILCLKVGDNAESVLYSDPTPCWPENLSRFEA